jgi:hypothetical protein
MIVVCVHLSCPFDGSEEAAVLELRDAEGNTHTVAISTEDAVALFSATKRKTATPIAPSPAAVTAPAPAGPTRDGIDWYHGEDNPQPDPMDDGDEGDDTPVRFHPDQEL